MVPLISQQEVTLTTVEEATGDKVVVGGSGGINKKHPDESLENYTDNMETSSTTKECPELNKATESSRKVQLHQINDQHETKKSRLFSESPTGIPAPSAALQVNPVKLLLPVVLDPIQGQTFAALQVLKVIESDAQPGDICTRREYARWLVSASNALSRNSRSKVYPAMYIENVTELAFKDITPDDPDFSFIQGLAEAGLISSKLSNPSVIHDPQAKFLFFPESPLSRQDLVSWKMALEKRQLPEANRKKLYQASGFKDIEKINPEAWPALIADLSSGEQGITALAFGCTRLFQPSKPVTKAQAAIALATGEASDIVSEEVMRIEAETMAEDAVSAHNDLVAQVEKAINDSFEKEVLTEREKANDILKMAEQVISDLERLRAQRDEETLALEKERLAIESEMKNLSKLRNELEEQFQSLMSNKTEISCDKERIDKLRKQAQDENQEIIRLQNDLEVERNALSMARDWAQEEANRVKEQAKALEEARGRWERHGIKVVVDADLSEESTSRLTWVKAGDRFSVEGTVNRAVNLVYKLKTMATHARDKSREVIKGIIRKILLLISGLKDCACGTGSKVEELKNRTISKAEELKDNVGSKSAEMRNKFSSKAEELRNNVSSKIEELKDAGVWKAKGTVEGMQKGVTEVTLAAKEGVKRVANDCRERVGKLGEKSKTT